VLLSDDLSMNALKGPLSVRTKAALFAGCDIVLHCNGSMDEMREVAEEAKPLQDHWLKRCETGLSQLAPPEPFDREAGESRLTELLGVRA
jgi:beta-N-acetylhexosaminidase